MTVRGTGGALVAFYLPSLGGAGAERVMLNLAIGFAERGFRTDLVLGSMEGPFLALVPPAVRVIDLKASRTLRALRPLARYLRRERPHTLLAALDHANVIAMAARRLAGGPTRVAISVHCGFASQIHGITSIRVGAIPLLHARLHRWADVIIAVSHGVADDFATTTGIPRARIDVIYNPVVTPELLPAALERPAHPWFEDSTRPVVLGVGRLTPQKNFPLLVEAFARISREHNARLVILGEGPERSALEALVQRYGIQDSVALPGFFQNPYACMARAAVFALSSDYEGLPTVLIESLAVGTPVVSTDCPSGPREILRGGTLGRLVPMGDGAALARAIACTLTAPRVPLPSDALRPFTPGVALDRYQRVLELHA